MNTIYKNRINKVMARLDKRIQNRSLEEILEKKIYSKPFYKKMEKQKETEMKIYGADPRFWAGLILAIILFLVI